MAVLGLVACTPDSGAGPDANQEVVLVGTDVSVGGLDPCSLRTTGETLLGFSLALAEGDAFEADTYFANESSFVWFSDAESVPPRLDESSEDRESLRDYFDRRVAFGERLRFVEVVGTPNVRNGLGMVDLSMVYWRSASDLPASLYLGKASFDCVNQVFVVWSHGGAVEESVAPQCGTNRAVRRDDDLRICWSDML